MKTMLNLLKNRYIDLSIFVIWLFHISAIIGISLGYQNWFVSKTPLNLLIQFALLILCFAINRPKKWLVFGVCFFTGILVEAIGVQHSFVFGSYYYGENLGLKIWNVPLLIGINWAILVFTTAVISNKITNNFFIKTVLGATLMVSLDVFMEVVAPTFDFWHFTNGHPPLRNFVTWFLVAFILHAIFQYFKLKGNFKFALHLYVAQLVFFTYFSFFL